LGLSGGFPASALASGADIVINSLHKTLPSLTQTALMHIKGNLVCDDKIKHSVNIFQSSSPSYILMASIDNCIRFLTRDGEDLFLKFIKRLDSFYNSLIDMENFELFLPDTCTEVFAFDKSRLVILCKNTDYTGKKLMNTLQKDYGLQLEMSAPNYALAITGICDTDNSFDVLKTALKSVDRQTVYTAGKNKNYSVPPILCQEINPGKAINIDGRSISFDECAFKFSQEYVWMYPPGIPIIVPGQRVTQEVIDYLLSISQIGGEINSTSGGMPYTLKVINQTLI
jgi:arginine/lysine/ornithine decarboxylase